MNEAEVRRLLMLRAFEERALSPVSASWSPADAAWASLESLRLQQGRSASPERLLQCRATLGCERLAARVPAVAKALHGIPLTAPAALLLVTPAFALGLALDAAGPSGRINILSPPFGALIAWNLLVYALLLVHALHRAARAESQGRPPGPLRALFVDKISGWRARRAAHTSGTTDAPALARYAADWAALGRPLHLARSALALHLAAFALAAGMLASLYLRGLAFEYRAGWDSTFLSAENVHGLLSIALAPALGLGGPSLPDAEHLAALRFSLQDGGENAARWIHLIALTVALVVLLPRATLAAFAAWRSRALARELPLALDTPYFQGVRRGLSGRPVRLTVLPYNYRTSEQAALGLTALLRQALGANVALTLAESLPLNAEDDLEHAWPPDAAPDEADLLLPLFSAAATPERETHGAFLRSLRERRTAKPMALALIDESGLRRQYGAAAAQRLPQRRAAWQALLDEAGLAALFVDLADPTGPDPAAAAEAGQALVRALAGGKTGPPR